MFCNAKTCFWRKWHFCVFKKNRSIEFFIFCLFFSLYIYRVKNIYVLSKMMNWEVTGSHRASFLNRLLEAIGYYSNELCVSKTCIIWKKKNLISAPQYPKIVTKLKNIKLFYTWIVIKTRATLSILVYLVYKYFLYIHKLL
jgi:hypothetical protein